MESIDFDKKVNMVISKFEEYNRINKDIKRFSIFNSFNITYELDGAHLYFEMRNTDDENIDLLTSVASEQSLFVNLTKDAEFFWAIKTLNRFIEKSKESMKKARELSKPQVGILIYDEFTDSYYLNPATGPVLLKSKEIAKEIASTRLDIFAIFIHLRNTVVGRDRTMELVGLNGEMILKKILIIIEELNQYEVKLRKIEGIPRFICLIQEIDSTNYYFEGFLTNDFGEEIEIKTKQNELQQKMNLFTQEGLEVVYSMLRLAQDFSKQMLDLARTLISKNEPKLYKQDTVSKLWILTSEGKKTMQNLSIMDFLNEDISEINFDINQ
ncbi:hypothetical protein SGLAD_v1c04680 [Spiroplasma gladiatoris]|uniref:Uncharacterized protein n=1 Tax=Spiroplasma gladiatoris TaxID=2143 RepID=A0A4P7AHJ2_9MOLU|nr:hypothetical protein [Spiroplasma gladiatoris]QBQ07667.1 hypothetical protein SGLAD_v1c04680 [Spiroplasma gladiatoris]